ncbi:MAG: DinB family protein [Planctomycetes bacterium]|nr:DinB family protein [Planctomycetota bacterium]
MHTYPLDDGPALLARTPALLDAWLRPLPAAWLTADEGPGTWHALEVLGHLIEGERHDWIPRARHLLQHGTAVPFAPFDRFAQQRRPHRTVDQLLDEFAACRAESLADLAALRLTAADLERRGRHPEFGVVTLGQHLATWLAHDLTHVVQIARAMAHRCREAVGPWRAYLRVVRDAGVSGTAP